MDARDRRALQRCQSRIVRDLDAEEILDHLLSREVITTDDYECVLAQKSRREGASLLLRTLQRRGPVHTFQALVEALRPNYDWLATALRTQQQELEAAQSGPAQEELERVLRAGGVPSLPVTRVERRNYRDRIRQLLRQLADGHFVAVHGMAGIGKSVAVNDAVRSAELVLERFPGGVFWLSVGRVDHDLLLNKLQALCERLTEESAAPPPATLAVAKERLRKLLMGRRQSALLVLDDVWSGDVVTLFDLDSRVLITTRDASVLDKVADRCHELPMDQGFSREQSQELFSLRLKIPVPELPAEAVDIHQRCGGVPMAISMVTSYLAARGRSRPTSTNRWQRCMEKIRLHEWGKLNARTSSGNVMDAIGLSVDSLEGELADKFRSLAVFGADVTIPLEVLCTYWQMGKEDVENLMLQLVMKSLVQEMVDDKLETMLYLLHDLIVDYLDTALSRGEKQELHGALVDAYRAACAGDYGRLPDDEYVLWYIGHHVYRSGRYQLFPELYFSLPFVGNKLRVTGPTDLLSDYRKYAEFIDAADAGDGRRRDFENFVRTTGHRLPPTPPAEAACQESHHADGQDDAIDPSAAVVQLALCQPDTSAVYRAAETIARGAHSQLYLKWCNKESMRWSSVLLTKVFSGPVCDVVFTRSPDLALAAYGDGLIKLWNVITGDEYPAFRGHSERVLQLTVSPDGARFVSASEDCTLKIWDLDGAVGATYASPTVQQMSSPRVRHSSSGMFRAGDEPTANGASRDDSQRTLLGHEAAVMCVDWSGDGARILSGDAAGAFMMWDTSPLSDPSLLHQEPAAHAGNVTCCTFSPDSSYFATGGADGKVKLWRTSDATLFYTFNQHQLRVISLCMSDNNCSIVSVAEKEIFCWVWSEDRRPSRTFETLQMSSRSEHDFYLCSRLSHDQRHLVVGTSSNMFETWDLRHKRVVATQRGFAGSVACLIFSCDGERLLAGAGDNVTSCCLTTTPKVEDSLQTLFAARFPSPLPESLIIAAVTSNNGVQVLHGLNGTVGTTTTPVGEQIRITVINPAATKVAFGCEDGSVGVYDMAAQRQAEPNILGKHSKRVVSLQFGPGDTVVSGSEDDTMKVWWLDKTNVTCGGNGGAVTQVGLYESEQGLLAVSCSRDGMLKVYLAKTGQMVVQHLAHSGSTVTCYRIVRYRVEGDASPQQPRRSPSPCPPDLVAVTAAVDGMVKMSRLDSGHVLKTFDLKFGPVRTFQLSRDNSILVTGHDDGHLVVTRTAEQRAPLQLQLHQSWVRDIVVSPDGRNILSVGDCLAWWRLHSHEEQWQGRSAPAVPPSPRLQPPDRQYYYFAQRRTNGGAPAGGLRATLRQVVSFRGTLARQVVVSDDWTTLVTIDDAGVLYIMQVM